MLRPAKNDPFQQALYSLRALSAVWVSDRRRVPRAYSNPLQRSMFKIFRKGYEERLPATQLCCITIAALGSCSSRSSLQLLMRRYTNMTDAARRRPKQKQENPCVSNIFTGKRGGLKGTWKRAFCASLDIVNPIENHGRRGNYAKDYLCRRFLACRKCRKASLWTLPNFRGHCSRTLRYSPRFGNSSFLLESRHIIFAIQVKATPSKCSILNILPIVFYTKSLG